MHTSDIGGYPALSHAASPQGPSVGVTQGLMAGILFLPWLPSGFTVPGEAVMGWLNGHNIFCLLMWQATFFFNWQYNLGLWIVSIDKAASLHSNLDVLQASSKGRMLPGCLSQGRSCQGGLLNGSSVVLTGFYFLRKKKSGHFMGCV